MSERTEVKAHIKWVSETEEGRRWVKLIVEATNEDEKALPHTRRARKLRREARKILEQRHKAVKEN